MTRLSTVSEKISEKFSGESKKPPLFVACNINGTEIRVGETKIQVLLDAGYEIAWSEMIPGTPPKIEEYTLDPEMQLERNSYYSGAHVTVGDHISVLISLIQRCASDGTDAGEGRRDVS